MVKKVTKYYGTIQFDPRGFCKTFSAHRKQAFYRPSRESWCSKDRREYVRVRFTGIPVHAWEFP